ncbi:MAG TPA: hypothetical protein VNR87_17255 [Flavisolibacter sp.]|nr:hypothetical protein [Flavisolibacter sp.]
MRKIIFIFCCIICFTAASAQTSPDKIKVFLDCTRSWLCDFDYVRSQMKAVDFVRDRFDADVHVLVNMQRSSSGGIQAELDFMGQKKYQNQNDTLTYFNDPTSTEDDQRKKLVQYLKLGLTRYVSKTSYAKQLDINFGEASSKDSSGAAPKKDRWNYWVFQFGGNASLNGSQNYKSHYFNGYLSADRETEEWKINFSVNANKDIETYIDASGESRFTRKDYSSSLQIAKSIDAHWSYGLAASYNNSLYSNILLGIRLRPKLEYSVFPYSQFNSQRIVFQYMTGPVYNHYYDTTIFFKKKETQLQQSLNMITSFTKPWGSINIGVFYSNYFDDFSKNNLSFNGAVSWRITKGLNFALWGYYGLIHDQIGLRKGNATRDELLVKNRELLSSFEYNLGVGFSYRFGSILNNIVNPRFKGLSYSINL